MYTSSNVQEQKQKKISHYSLQIESKSNLMIKIQSLLKKKIDLRSLIWFGFLISLSKSLSLQDLVVIAICKCEHRQMMNLSRTNCIFQWRSVFLLIFFRFFRFFRYLYTIFLSFSNFIIILYITSFECFILETDLRMLWQYFSAVCHSFKIF